MSELTDEQLHEYFLLRLEEQLQALAMPADVQLTCYPEGSAKVDELADDFGELYTLQRDSRWRDISQEQRVPLDTIDALLAIMSGPKPYWTEDALRTRPEWETVRGLAKQALDAFGWEVKAPIWKHTYKYRDDGTISSSTSISARWEALRQKWERERIAPNTSTE